MTAPRLAAPAAIVLLVPPAAARAAALADGTGPQADLRYASAPNVTGAPLPGYGRGDRILLRPKAAAALERVEQDLRRRGLVLRVFGAYRPARATRSTVGRDKRHRGGPPVATGFPAVRSNHDRGLAVDLTLVRRPTGRALDIRTAYDAFLPPAATRNAAGRVTRNRRTLVRAMARRGFANYHREPWHFDFPVRGPAPRHLDETVGCRST